MFYYYCHYQFLKPLVMKKIFCFCSLFFFLPSIHSFAQTSVTAGPEQKVKAVMRMPEAVRPGSSFSVKIEITKGNISGLGRFQQYLPTGMTASAIETGGADFIFENQYVKFIWVSLPQDETVIIRYSVVTESSLITAKTISGTFSYVENGRTKSYSLLPKEIRIDANAPVEEPVAQEPERKLEPPKGEAAPVMVETTPDIGAPPKEETIPETPPPTESKPESENVVAQQTVVVPEQKTEEKKPADVSDAGTKAAENVLVNKTPAPQPSPPAATVPAAGIVFRVQIAAMNEKRFRKDGHFQKAFSIDEKVYKEVHQGLKKYTVGNCATYKTARSLRKGIITNVEGAFIVAYYDGVRIPVPDAISILKKN